MLNIIFPSLCYSCKNITAGSQLCKTCSSDIRLIDQSCVCVCCGVPFDSFGDTSGFSSHRCESCIKQLFNFSSCRSIAHFDGTVRELLHAFKYRKKIGLGKFFANLIGDYFPRDIKGFDLLIPVPLHIKKLREREYNQSAVFVNILSGILKCEKDLFSLVKSSETEPQINFKNSKLRKKNVINSFSLRNVKKVKKRSILLVDDVYTSGSTLNECAKVLLGAGADKVQAITLLRAAVI